MDKDFNRMFSYLHCRYIGLKVDLVLIRLVDMSFNGMFLDPHCSYRVYEGIWF